MLARRSILRHPSGLAIETPLLIPSFSSKGFRFDKKGKSVVVEVLRLVAEDITDSMLVSAYDIYHKHIPPHYFRYIPEIIFIDSGGYETADEHDMSAVFRHSCEAKKWNEERLQSVLDKWPPRIPAVFVSYDHSHISVPRQIAKARELFKRYPDHLHSMVIKPKKKNELAFESTLPSVLDNITQFAYFDIIGITEKEMGDSLLLRMVNIAKIRKALDKAEVNVPIQVFGSLDPLSSCLYFLAGAEIFDGLTWLRYSYFDGKAIYNYNYGATELGIHEKDSFVQGRALIDNISYLRNLQYKMKDFLLEHDFNKLEPHGEFLKNSYDTLRTTLKGGK